MKAWLAFAVLLLWVGSLVYFSRIPLAALFILALPAGILLLWAYVTIHNFLEKKVWWRRIRGRKKFKD